MGRRSRKRGGPAPGAGGSTRAERDAARERRARSTGAGGDAPARRGKRARPQGPWGNFPITELVILVAIVIGLIGLFVQGDRGKIMFITAFVLACLGGLEVSVREHFAGYRSHSTLLAGFAAAVAIGVLLLPLLLASTTVALPIPLIAGVIVFAIAFRALRQTFRRRSGGLSFR